MTFPRWPLAALIALFITGCTVGPSAPPASTLPLPPDAPADPPLTDQWWMMYHDTALNAAVSEALRNNRDLRVAAADLLTADALADETGAQSLPATRFTSSAGYGSTLSDQLQAALDNSQDIRRGSRYGIGMDVSWELDLSGRLRRMRQADSADSEATQADADAVRVEVAAATTRAWLNVCSDTQQIAVARYAVHLAELGASVTARLQLAGAVGETDRLNAQLVADAARSTLPGLAAQREHDLSQLAVLMGRLPTNPPLAAVSCTQPPELPDAAMPWRNPTQMLKRRPDVRAAADRLRAATAQIGVEVSGLYPQVTLGSSIFTSAPQIDGWRKSGASVWSLGPLISWSFPDISATRARIAGANAGEQKALANFDQVILRALQEMQDALARYRADQQELAETTLTEQHSCQTLALARASYIAGAITEPEFIDSERNLIRSQQQLLQVRAQWLNSQITLFKALGGGWQQAPRLILPVPVRSSVPLTAVVEKNNHD